MDCPFERARQGDLPARQALVEALHPRISRMAAYYARRSGEDAEDLLQEAWVGLLEALPELDVRIGSPEQYLIRHARWRLLDAIKRALRRRCPSLEDLPHLECAAGPADAPAQAEVQEFLRVLKPVQRSVLAMLLEGFTWRETGAALGCTSANVAYHVRQIRRRYEAFSAPSPAGDRGGGGAHHTASPKGGG